MNQLKSILVGVDFSDCSRSALEQATRLAKGNHARLHALHCVKFPVPPWWSARRRLPLGPARQATLVSSSPFWQPTRRL